MSFVICVIGIGSDCCRSVNMNKICYVGNVLIVWLTILSSVPGTLGYYCNHDLCREDQYCCGDNLCCDYVYSLWYFWIGVVILVIILSVCGGFFRYCYDSNSYVILQTCKTDYYPTQSLDDDDEKDMSCVLENMDAPPPYPGTQFSESFDKGFHCYSPGYEHGTGSRSSFQHQHKPNLLVHFN